MALVLYHVEDAAKEKQLSALCRELHLTARRLTNADRDRAVAALCGEKVNANVQKAPAGSFKGVVPGAAWWFCDHKRGMEEQLNIMAETGHLGQFTGMLTDSRSFLSYARHDYFRRVLCNRVAEELMDGTFLSEKAALKLLTDLCVENSRKLFGE